MTWRAVAVLVTILCVVAPGFGSQLVIVGTVDVIHAMEPELCRIWSLKCHQNLPRLNSQTVRSQ